MAVVDVLGQQTGPDAAVGVLLWLHQSLFVTKTVLVWDTVSSWGMPEPYFSLVLLASHRNFILHFLHESARLVFC